MIGYLTTREVAIGLDVTLRRAHQLVATHPKAERVSGVWLLPTSSLADLMARNTKRGRPKKAC